MSDASCKPRVSIIIPVYNDEATIARAIESCLAQTIEQLEIVVVDDASTDGTPGIAAAYADRNSRVRIVTHSENRQLLEARRTGVMTARADRVLFLDADDWLDAGVCERSLAVATEADADIVCFSIVPEYETAEGAEKPRAEAIAAYEHLYAAPNLDAREGDVVHATYRDNRVVWSLCGKMFLRAVLLEAFASVPSQRMFQSEDAYLYFVIAACAHGLSARSNLPVYHYSMGLGGTHTGCNNLSRASFASLCAAVRAAEGVEAFIASRPNGAEYASDVAALRMRLVADPVERFPDKVAECDRSEAFDELIEAWPAWEAIGALALRHWNNPVAVMEAVQGATSLKLHSHGVKTVAVYYSGLGTGGAERVTRDDIVLWQSMGYRVVFFHNDDAPSDESFALPEGAESVALPTCFGPRTDYPKRARTLYEALRAHKVDAFVYSQWLSPTLPWDMLVIRSLGVPVIVRAHGVFSVLMGYNMPDLLRVPCAYRLASGVVCMSEVDCAFWDGFVPRTWRVVNAVAPAFLDREAATLDSHVVAWVGRVSPDKNPMAALNAFAIVRTAVPDARLKFIGPMFPGIEEGFLAHARELGIMDAIELCGNVGEADMPDAYRGASVMMMTSRFEGYCCALAEAKASGLPCAMYELPYLALVQGGEAVGVVAAPMDDTSVLAYQITRLLNNENLRKQLGNAARNHMRAVAAYDNQAVWAEVFEYLEQDAGQTANTGSIEPKNKQAQAMWDVLLATVERALREGQRREASLHAEIQKERSTCEALASQCEESCRELDAVNGSVSFRIGRAITAPLRFVRDLARDAGKS